MKEVLAIITMLFLGLLFAFKRGKESQELKERKEDEKAENDFDNYNDFWG